VTIVAVENKCVLHILSVSLCACLSHPALNVRVPNYIVICDRFYSIMHSTLSHKWHDFRKIVHHHHHHHHVHEVLGVFPVP